MGLVGGARVAASACGHLVYGKTNHIMAKKNTLVWSALHSLTLMRILGHGSKTHTPICAHAVYICIYMHT